MNAMVASVVGAEQVLDWSQSAGYVIGAWGLSAGILGGYIWSVLRRGRRLSAEIPADKRRWM